MKAVIGSLALLHLLSSSVFAAQLAHQQAPLVPRNLTARSTAEEARSLYLVDETDRLDPRSSLPGAWFTANVGLMLERDEFPSIPASTNGGMLPVTRRDGQAVKRTRDFAREERELGFTDDGDLVLAVTKQKRDGTLSELTKRAKKAARKVRKKAQRKGQKKGKKGKSSKSKGKKAKSSPKQKGATKATGKAQLAGQKAKAKAKSAGSLISAKANAIFTATITWYTGVDLLRPFCADGSGWTPTDTSMIAAVTEQWGSGRPKCGSFLKLKTADSDQSVVVRVVDLCGGCKPGLAHVDLSKAAFQALYHLDVGIKRDIQVTTLDSPPIVGAWTKLVTSLFGPEVL